MNRIIKIGLLVLLVAAFLVIAECMPILDEKYCEKQYLDRYVLVKQESQEKIHYDLSMTDKLPILTSYQMESFLTEIFSTHSINELNENDEELIPKLQKEIVSLEEQYMMPQVQEMKLQEHFREAHYYNICNKENPNLAVAVWSLSFGKSDGSRYNFVIDANTHKIYYTSMKMTNSVISEFFVGKGFEGELAKVWNDATDTVVAESYGYDESLVYMELFVQRMVKKISPYYEAESFECINMYGDFIMESVLVYYRDGKVMQEIPYAITYSPSDMDGMEYLEMGISIYPDIETITGIAY